MQISNLIFQYFRNLSRAQILTMLATNSGHVFRPHIYHLPSARTNELLQVVRTKAHLLGVSERLAGDGHALVRTFGRYCLVRTCGVYSLAQTLGSYHVMNLYVQFVYIHYRPRRDSKWIEQIR